LENAQLLREQLHKVAANSTVGQYSMDSIEALLTIKMVGDSFLILAEAYVSR